MRPKEQQIPVTCGRAVPTSELGQGSLSLTYSTAWHRQNSLRKTSAMFITSGMSCFGEQTEGLLIQILFLVPVKLAMVSVQWSPVL